MDCALTVKTKDPAKRDLCEPPTKQTTNLPGLVQAAAHGSKRGAHDVGDEAVQHGAEGRAEDYRQWVREPGGQSVLALVLLAHRVEARRRRGRDGGAFGRGAERVGIGERTRGDDGRIEASV